MTLNLNEALSLSELEVYDLQDSRVSIWVAHVYKVEDGIHLVVFPTPSGMAATYVNDDGSPRSFSKYKVKLRTNTKEVFDVLLYEVFDNKITSWTIYKNATDDVANQLTRFIEIPGTRRKVTV